MRIACLSLLLVSSILTGNIAQAATAKSYQVTGPVIEMSDQSLVVQKGSEKWEILRDKDSKIPADVKVGSKVTVQYKMLATTVESKGEATKEEKKKS